MSNAISLPQAPESSTAFNVNLHVVASPRTQDAEEPNPLKERIVQISTYALLFLGALFLFASTGLFGMGLFGMVGSTTATLAETMYPIGVLSLMAGVSLVQDNKKNPLSLSSSLGPISISM